jgi:hypothetical protein
MQSKISLLKYLLLFKYHFKVANNMFFGFSDLQVVLDAYVMSHMNRTAGLLYFALFSYVLFKIENANIWTPHLVVIALAFCNVSLWVKNNSALYMKLKFCNVSLCVRVRVSIQLVFCQILQPLSRYIYQVFRTFG